MRRIDSFDGPSQPSRFNIMARFAVKRDLVQATVTPGNGTSIHLSGVMLEKAAGIKLTHVPYKGSNPALIDALAGNVDLLVSSVPSAIAQIKVAPTVKDLKALQTGLAQAGITGRSRHLDTAVEDNRALLSAPRLHRSP